MKIVSQTVTHIPQPTENHAEWLEKIGRVCYKSEDKITAGSAEKFLNMLVSNGHTSVLEHLYFTVMYGYGSLHSVYFRHDGDKVISGNVRTIYEAYKSNGRKIDIDIPTIIQLYSGSHIQMSDMIHSAETFHIVTDRATSHELVRHRTASISMESQRYCVYSKDKFGGEVTFIQPIGMIEGEFSQSEWKKICENTERSYFALLRGNKPEIARSVLPNSTKTELYMTCRLKDWKHFLDLRLSPKAAPQIRNIAEKIQIVLKEKYPEFSDNVYRNE